MVIGIIGGGQLGMFLAINAYRMGYETIIYDENDECCAKGIANRFVQGSFSDKEKLEDFMKECDVITYEFENIDSNLIDDLSKKYNIPQKATPLKLASSRRNERELALKLDINQPKWQSVENVEELALNYPYILKIDSLGYDGKGQYLINIKDDLKKVDFNGKRYLAEEKIDFDYEISLIAIRSLSNELVIYTPFYNIHHNGILHMSLVNQVIPSIICDEAKKAIKKIINAYDIYGILCCEFLVKGDTLYFNEMAPRPHNSGHITMDTHYCSQYENHLRAILDLPLGSTKIKNSGFMVNVLGQDKDKIFSLLNKYPHYIKYYDYHKSIRENRKVGHLVCFNDELLELFKNEWR